MIILNTISETKMQIQEWKRSGYSIGFVPTMGFLHEGHISLVNRSVAENDKTVVSIFVNPMQFGPNEDLEKYPRDFAADEAMCKEAKADLIFYPTPDEMYPKGFVSYIDMDNSPLTNALCGKSRPGHFRGVCTVVAKLFNIVAADSAYFGKKDAQQLAIIQKMVQDLDININIIPCPTVREPDGLAKSSRNSYLSPEERAAAVSVSRAIFEGERLIKGDTSLSDAKKAMTKIIEAEPLAKIDYVELIDLYQDGSVLGAVAVFFGKTRLIDNFLTH